MISAPTLTLNYSVIELVKLTVCRLYEVNSISRPRDILGYIEVLHVVIYIFGFPIIPVVPVVLLTLLSMTRELVGCPSICTCNSTQTDCSSRNLHFPFNLISSQVPTNVTTLNLSRNAITQLNPGVFTNLSSLLKLDLSRNQLLTLHSSTFYPLSNLEFLDLSCNFLENLPVDLFSELSNLRELILSDNRLKEVSSKQFQSLAELQRLDLSMNNIGSMSLDILDGLQGLEWLSLAGNKLRTIPRSVLEPLTVLQQLLLDGNQWNCSCSLLPFRHWVEWMLYRGEKNLVYLWEYT